MTYSLTVPGDRSGVERLRVHARRALIAPATVSVVIPCFNYGRFLAQAVLSVLRQEGVTTQIIIVDDASTDDSVEVARALASRYSNVRLLRHQTNSGPVDSFNDGLREVKGEFLVRLDADDLLTPGSLQRAAVAAQHFPSVGLVYGHPLHFTGSRLPKPRTRPKTWTIWRGERWLENRCREGANVITSPEVFMRSSVVDRVGGQRRLAHAHDMEMWLRIATASDVLFIGGADQAWHREHAQSLSAREVDRLVDLHERMSAFALVFGEEGSKEESAKGNLRRARAALACTALRYVEQSLDNPRFAADEVTELVRFAEAACDDPNIQTRIRQALVLASNRSSAQKKLARLKRRAYVVHANYLWRRTGEYSASSRRAGNSCLK